MLRTLKWLASLTVAAIALVLAAVVFGGRDPDWNGTVVLRWDPERRALEWMQRPRMARDGPYVFCEAHGYTVVETMPSDTGWRLQTGRLPAHPLPVITVRVGD